MKNLKLYFLKVWIYFEFYRIYFRMSKKRNSFNKYDILSVLLSLDLKDKVVCLRLD